MEIPGVSEERPIPSESSGSSNSESPPYECGSGRSSDGGSDLRSARSRSTLAWADRAVVTSSSSSLLAAADAELGRQADVAVTQLADGGSAAEVAGPEMGATAA